MIAARSPSAHSVGHSHVPPMGGSFRHAVTLVEVLLVLALLVALVSISWPALERPLSNQRLRNAADAVRVEWGRARIEAMSSGQTLLFRYSIEGDRYAIERQAGPESSPDVESADGSAGLSGYQSRPGALYWSELKLPDGVIFLSGETAEDTRADALGLESGVSGEADMNWSEPILFYPDGTTSAATLVLKNEYDRCIEMSLRGLTGVVNVGETYSLDQ